MPRTRNPPIRRNNAELQRRSVMRASRADGMDLVVDAHHKHFGIRDALDLGLDFFQVRDVLERGEVFEFVFGHGGCTSR